MKNEIIISLFDFVKGIDNRKQLLIDIDKMAKHYNLKVNKIAPNEGVALKDALKDFLLNHEGFKHTINRLYNAVKYYGKYRITYKYNKINKLGKQESWSGIFKTKKEADAWKEINGKDVNLILIEKKYLV